MRESKFRAWDKTNQIYFRGCGFLCFVPNGIQFHWIKDGEAPMVTRLVRNECELLRYTGLKDSDVVEEYFGDIIEENDGTRRIIEDGCSAVLFKDVITGGIKYFWELSFHKVIGNIYENKELLEEVNDV